MHVAYPLPPGNVQKRPLAHVASRTGRGIATLGGVSVPDPPGRRGDAHLPVILGLVPGIFLPFRVQARPESGNLPKMLFYLCRSKNISKFASCSKSNQVVKSAGMSITKEHYSREGTMLFLR